MEAWQPAERELHEQLAKVRELIAESRDNGYELDCIEEDLRQLFGDGQVSQLYFDIQLVRLRKAHQANRQHTQTLTHSRKLLMYKLSTMR